MLVGGQARENRHFVDLELLKAHEKVVDVAVLPLHDDLAEDSGQLLLLWGDQGCHRERVHRSGDERCHDQLEDLALLQNHVVCLLLRLFDQLVRHRESEGERASFRVSFKRDANGPVLHIERHWIALRVLPGGPTLFGNVTPVEKTDVGDRFSTV